MRIAVALDRNPLFCVPSILDTPSSIYFNSASRDRYFLNLESNQFHAHLDKLGVEHTFRSIEDVHGWVSLRNNFEEILAFHDAAFRRPPADRE